SLLHLEPLPPRATRGEVLAFVCNTGGIDGRQVGRIDLHGPLATVQVPEAWGPRLVKALDGAAFRERRVRAWISGANTSPNADDHFQRLPRLLELESAAEAEQALQQAQRLSPAEAERSGDCLIGLVVRDEQPGLGGRFILTLTKRDPAQPLP